MTDTRTTAEAIERDVASYDPELDNIDKLIFDVCDRLAQLNVARFLVSGFGQAIWPVDVNYDLPFFIEQLPDILDWVGSARSEPFTLHFPEQGIERLLTFEHGLFGIEVTCQSYNVTWDPEPGIERIDPTTLRLKMCTVMRQFIELTKTYCPAIYRHMWFQEWMKGASVQECLADDSSHPIAKR
jgi:hypothetical protein